MGNNRPSVDTNLAALRRDAREGQAKVLNRSAAFRATLPLRYMRQQAHLTAPASDRKLAEKALSNAYLVAQRLMDRYGLNSAIVAERLGVDASTVDEVLASGGAPVVVLDLEDGVSPQMVDAARANAIELARDVDRGSTLCFIRPAGVADPRCADDLVELLVTAGRGRPPEKFPIDGIVFPKVRHVHEVEWLNSVLSSVESALELAPNQIRVSYQIETGWGVLNLPQLAVAGIDRLAGIILGTVDLGADLLLPEVRYQHPINEWARMVMVAVAGAAGVPALDGMTLDFPIAQADLTADENRSRLLERMETNFNDALHSIDVGMAGRWVGHPLQLLATVLAFRAAFSADAIEARIRELQTFSEAIDADKGAVAGPVGELLDVGTDRHIRSILRRATAWGLVPVGRAVELGLITTTESKSLGADAT